MSTPILTAAGKPIGDPKFGRIVERTVFGLSVDWRVSSKEGHVPAGFIQDFLKSIRENGKLPIVPHNAVLYGRSNPIKFYGGGGADISQEGITQ